MFSRGLGNADEDYDLGFGSGLAFDDYDDFEGHEANASTAYNDDTDVVIEEPIFSKRRLPFRPPPNTQITQTVCAAGCMYIVLSEKTIVCYPIERQDDKLDELTPFTGKQHSGTKIDHIWVDPTGSHLIACALTHEGYDSVYVHLRAQAKRTPQRIRKLQGHKLTAVAWNPFATAKNNTTKEILIGDAQGVVHELEIVGVPRYCHQVFAIENANEQITGIHLDFQHSTKLGTAVYIIVACTSRLRHFLGTPGANQQRYAQIFSKNELASSGTEAPPYARSHMSIFQHLGAPANALAWLTPLGVYHGKLDFVGALADRTSALPSSAIIPYHPEHDSGLAEDIPLAIQVTEFHILLMYKSSVVALCTLNQSRVVTVKFPTRGGDLLGVCRDEQTSQILCYTPKTLYLIDHKNETRDLWRLMMNKGLFDEALSFCSSKEEENEVLLKKANSLFDNQDFVLAAAAFSATDASFETIALKFIDKQQDKALRQFLLQKLSHLPRDDMTQRALLCTWLVELFLNDYNKSAGEGDTVESEDIMAEFKKFLQREDCKDVLHKETTLDLILSHGNLDALLFFATLHKQYGVVLQHYIQLGDHKKAIDLLSTVGGDEPELVYRFASELIENTPAELMQLCRSLDSLDPKKLIPAFVRHQQKCGEDMAAVQQIISYLEWSINHRDCREQAIHNYLIALYVKLDDTQPLMTFINGQLKKETIFDRKYALRVCTEHKRMKACVALYSSLGLFEEAVDLALDIDLQLAYHQAEMFIGDDSRRKHLWLKIVRHVIRVRNDIDLAMKMLKDYDFLKIEDILPFFEDFKIIDSFQETIQRSLEEYNSEIKDLQDAMEQSTLSAKHIRDDISHLNKRMERVSGKMSCRICNYPLLTRSFYLFPCRHAFHKDCFIRRVATHLPPSEKRKVARLTESLRSIRDDTSQVEKVNQLNVELDKVVGKDCVLCGDMAIDMIEVPFIAQDELPQYIESWSLGDVDFGAFSSGEEQFGEHDKAPVELKTFVS